MTSESTSQSLPKKLTCPTNVHFELADALVIQPSAVYNKYLRDLWYSTEVLDNTITFSLSYIEKSLSFDRDIFASIIGLEYSKEYVSLPNHEAMKDSIATLGADDLFGKIPGNKS
ncbi:hypothetical protein Tco_1519435 [Tanacetum coccineum]